MLCLATRLEHVGEHFPVLLTHSFEKTSQAISSVVTRTFETSFLNPAPSSHDARK